MLIMGDRQIDIDAQGYLMDISDWSEEIVPILAEQEAITLTAQHWEVIHFIREFYFEFNTSPAVRLLVKSMEQKFGPEKGNSRYLFSLFPKGPALQATKLAGLPKPAKCL